MLLQNLHHRYLHIVIQLPYLKDLDQKIPSFPNCDNYGIHRASNPNLLNDDTRTNDNELHQQLCRTFKIDYLQEMDIITIVKSRLECKINVTLPALLPNKIVRDPRGPVTSSDRTEQDKPSSRDKRAIPLLAIAQGTAAIGGMLIKGINTLVDAKRVNSFNNAIKMLIANVEITLNRLVTLENRTSMMVKAIMPVLKDFKLQINKTSDQLASQYRMMSSAHNRYNSLFRWMYEMQTIHHFALQISLCANIGYMYYCEYAHLLKKRTEHTCMSAIYYDQESEIKANQCKTIVTFDNTPKSKILDAGNILILLNLQKPWTIACKDVSRVFEIEYSTYRILNKSELCECSLTAGNYLLSQTDTNCGDMPEARDCYFTTYYAFHKIILDVITVKFNIQVDDRTIIQSTLFHDDIPGYNLPTLEFVSLPVNDDEDLILKEENPEIYVPLENVLVHMIYAQDVAIFKSQKIM